MDHTVDLPRVFLVEDTQSEELLSVLAIRSCGVPARLNVFHDGEEVLDVLLKEDEPIPKLLILDFKMPKYNGLEVLTRVRSLSRLDKLAVIIFSSARPPRETQACYEAGANCCLDKPLDSGEYVRVLGSQVLYWLSAGNTVSKAIRRTGNVAANKAAIL